MGYVPWPRNFDLEWARKQLSNGRLFYVLTLALGVTSLITLALGVTSLITLGLLWYITW